VTRPRRPQLRPSSWWRALVRSASGFRRDNCVDLAAALTFWAVLSVFPGAIVVVALVGLVASSDTAVDTIMEVVDDAAPAEAASALEDRLREVVGRRTAAGVLLSFGVLAAVWTASAYLRSFTRAANAIYGVPEGRPFWRLIPQQLGLTVVALVLVAVVVAGLVVSGPVAGAIGGVIGVEQTAITVWNMVRWPVLVLTAGLLLSLLFWVAPNVERPRFRWFAAGSAVALLLWIAVSAGFGFYVANVGSYDATYGALGAVIVFLLWVFLGNCAVLLGVEINAELQRARRRQARRRRGHQPGPAGPAGPAAPPLPPRATA
jgi:membrane protein